jgi:hypothetical protein
MDVMEGPIESDPAIRWQQGASVLWPGPKGKEDSPVRRSSLLAAA